MEPKADPVSTVIFRRCRITVLTNRMARMEWSEDGRFEDWATLTVMNRRTRPVPFTKRMNGKRLTVNTWQLSIEYIDDGRPFHAGNLKAKFKMDGRSVEWRYGMTDPSNLGGTIRTLDGIRGDRKVVHKKNDAGEWVESGTEPVDLGDGLVSRSGWAVVDDSGTTLLKKGIRKNSLWVAQREGGARQVIYLLAYGHDYKAALKDASLVFGRQPLPPRYAFGYWYSRYWAYTDKEIEELVSQFDEMRVPIDVMVIDMDWHLMGWTGYTWDRDYFPDPAELLSWLRKRGLKVTLNLHPADGVGKHEEQFERVCRHLGKDPGKTDRIPFDCTDPEFIEAYFKYLHRPYEKMGVDFWWLDWQQGKTTTMPGLDPLPWLNHLYWVDQERNRSKKRPMNFSRFGGLGSGRYPVGFSGDTYSEWESLAFQPYFTSTAANVLYGYWSHDIGGHQPGPIEPELFTRWVQFGTFSPILRTHTTKNPASERRVWLYPDPYNRIMMDCIRLRYELVPYIYSESGRCLDTGVSFVHPLYYEFPEAEKAYDFKGQYMFGGSLLVAPIVKPVEDKSRMAEARVWLPEGDWVDTATGEVLKGGKVHARHYLIEEIPVFARPGTMIPGQRGALRLEPGSYRDMLVTILTGADGSYDLYEDDGISNDYLHGKCASIPMRYMETGSTRSIEIGPARGDFDGFLEERSLEVRVGPCAPPLGVVADGRDLEWSYRLEGRGWAYDGDSATTVIRIPRFDVRKGVSIRLKVDKKGEKVLIPGMKGLMLRLGKICQHVNAVSPVNPITSKERFAVKVAQTGNRIGRDPRSFLKEVGQLKLMLKELAPAIEEMQDAYRKKGRGEFVSILQKAKGILERTKADWSF